MKDIEMDAKVARAQEKVDMKAMLDAKIVRVQEKIVYMEVMLDDLSEVVTSLNAKVARIERDNAELRADMTPVDPTRTPEDEVPPHYGPGGVGTK